MIRKAMTLVALLPAVLAALPAASTGTGAISGTIVDEAGQPQPGVQLHCQKLSEFTKSIIGGLQVKKPGFVRSVLAGSGGKFAISGLPPGRYYLCAAALRPNQVGSCEWGGVAVIDLAAGQIIQDITRIVREGALVTVRVADPNRRIAAAGARGLAPLEGRFSVEFVSPSGSQRRAERISNSAAEHIFQITVPKRWPMRLFLDTALKVTSESGEILETRRPSARPISATDRDQVTVNLVAQ